MIIVLSEYRWRIGEKMYVWHINFERRNSRCVKLKKQKSC